MTEPLNVPDTSDPPNDHVDMEEEPRNYHKTEEQVPNNDDEMIETDKESESMQNFEEENTGLFE